MNAAIPALPWSMQRLPRDRRGLPVPHVAGWTSETWGVARAEHLIKGRPVALFTRGRQGRGRPQFDVVNEARQRRAVLLGRCQVCDTELPRGHGPTHGHNRPIGWLPTASIGAATFDGQPVTHEPLCCLPCARWAAQHCCVLARGTDDTVTRVDDWRPLIQLIDPSADKPRKHPGETDDLERLGRIARAQQPQGLVGFVKVILDRHQLEDQVQLRSMLSEVYVPAGVEIWMRSRQQQFDGLTVAEMIESGRYHEVLAAAEQLTTGAYA